MASTANAIVICGVTSCDTDGVWPLARAASITLPTRVSACYARATVHLPDEQADYIIG